MHVGVFHASRPPGASRGFQGPPGGSRGQGASGPPWGFRASGASSAPPKAPKNHTNMVWNEKCVRRVPPKPRAWARLKFHVGWSGWTRPPTMAGGDAWGGITIFFSDTTLSPNSLWRVLCCCFFWGVRGGGCPHNIDWSI